MLCGFTILAGVAIALLPERRRNTFTGSPFWGVCFGLLAAAGQGGGAVLSRKAFAVASVAGQTIDAGTAAYQRILGGLGLTLLFTAVIKGDRWWSCWSSEKEPQTEPMGSTRSVWRTAGPWILFNSLAGPVLGVTCYQWALATLPTGIVLPIVATTPLVVIPIARVTDGERAGVRSIIGGVIAVLGAVVLTWTN